MTLTRRAFIVGAPCALAACSAEYVWAPDDVVKAATYRNPGASVLRLYTVRNSGSDNGAHTALMIDASERVLFDPAGSFKAQGVPERNDVLHGFSPVAETAYRSFHARSDFYIAWQTVAVPPAVAEQALVLAKANGAVPKANCTRATSSILKQLPGFESLRTTWFPNNLQDAFANIPGVVTEELREFD
ncbi:MAG: hypothetical protein AAFP98_04075 [Pseudomonadota bacterium]